MIDLTINTNLAQTILTGFIHSELTRTGFSRAVIGLSGGIDSALSCYLAAQALGPENVLAIRMPYRTSSQDSLDHAQLVIDALGVQSLTEPITEMVEPLFDRFPDSNNVRRGNVMARARMIILFDQSEAFRGLVVGTSNKTEILLGYSTLYGDSACAINPLGDLYKAQVRQLSRALGVPDVIVDKAPSADLWAGQTDEEELGYSYQEIDHLLYYLVDMRYSDEMLANLKFSDAMIKDVKNKIQTSQFKRRPPVIAKLSNRTINQDFRYCRDWGV